MRSAFNKRGQGGAGNLVRNVQVHGPVLPHTVHHPHHFIQSRDLVVGYRVHVHRPCRHRRGCAHHVQELPLQVCVLIDVVCLLSRIFEC